MNDAGRILGVDVGTVRIGVAISDEDRLFAQPVGHICVNEASPVAAIDALCRQYQVQTVVIGLPLAMSGGEGGDGSRRARALGEALRSKLNLTIRFVDERFSTHAADRALIEGRVRRQKRKQVVDQVAAAFILQGYLDGQ